MCSFLQIVFFGDFMAVFCNVNKNICKLCHQLTPWTSATSATIRAAKLTTAEKILTICVVSSVLLISFAHPLSITPNRHMQKVNRIVNVIVLIFETKSSWDVQGKLAPTLKGSIIELSANKNATAISVVESKIENIPFVYQSPVSSLSQIIAQIVLNMVRFFVLPFLRFLLFAFFFFSFFFLVF